MGDQVIEGASGSVGASRHADAGGDDFFRAGVFMGNLQFKYRSANALSHLFGAMDVGVGEQHDKFLAAITGEDVGGALEGSLQRCRYLFQAAVAHWVAVIVVKQLKVIDVEHNHRYWGMCTLGNGPLLFRQLIKGSAVVELGETITLTEPL